MCDTPANGRQLDPPPVPMTKEEASKYRESVAEFVRAGNSKEEAARRSGYTLTYIREICRTFGVIEGGLK